MKFGHDAGMLHDFKASDAGFVDGELTRPHNVAKVLRLRCREITFSQFQQNIGTLQSLKDFIRSFKMLVKTFKEIHGTAQIHQTSLPVIFTE